MANDSATASLVLGIIALFIGWIPIIGWTIIILAIVLGVKGVKRHTREPEIGGEGRAIAGIVLGAMAGIFALIMIPFFGGLLYFGTLSPDKYLPDRCMISGGFSCTDFKIDGDMEEIRFRIVNNLGTGAQDVTVSLSSGACRVSGSPATVGALRNREDTPLQFGCPGIEPGTTIEADITITYRMEGENELRTAGGSLAGTVY